MESHNICSIFYLVLWKFWKLSPQQKYALFFQPNGNPTWAFWGFFLDFWVLLGLFWEGIVKKTWADHPNTIEHNFAIFLAHLSALEFTYNGGFMLFWGIGLGHFLSVEEPNYKAKSFIIQLVASIILTILCFFKEMDAFFACLWFSVLGLILQIIGFLCIHPMKQLLDKSSAYSSTILDEHLTNGDPNN